MVVIGFRFDFVFNDAVLMKRRRICRIYSLAFILLLFSTTDAGSSIKETVRVLNGTTLTLECDPAELLVRTHMAPDFENPQLVRRLDWFHDDAIIATFQQVSLCVFATVILLLVSNGHSSQKFKVGFCYRTSGEAL